MRQQGNPKTSLSLSTVPLKDLTMASGSDNNAKMGVQKRLNELMNLEKKKCGRNGLRVIG